VLRLAPEQFNIKIIQAIKKDGVQERFPFGNVESTFCQLNLLVKAKLLKTLQAHKSFLLVKETTGATAIVLSGAEDQYNKNGVNAKLPAFATTCK